MIDNVSPVEDAPEVRRGGAVKALGCSGWSSGAAREREGAEHAPY